MNRLEVYDRVTYDPERPLTSLSGLVTVISAEEIRIYWRTSDEGWYTSYTGYRRDVVLSGEAFPWRWDKTKQAWVDRSIEEVYESDELEDIII